MWSWRSLLRVACGAAATMLALLEVDCLPFQVAVHNREEHLEEKVDGIYQHRQ
jgi:hypothetical protein